MYANYKLKTISLTSTVLNHNSSSYIRVYYNHAKPYIFKSASGWFDSKIVIVEYVVSVPRTIIITQLYNDISDSVVLIFWLLRGIRHPKDNVRMYSTRGAWATLFRSLSLEKRACHRHTYRVAPARLHLYNIIAASKLW